ncbi:MAG: hypothetical protein EKK54_09950 [Neisseriaceae bacterium]|nr:MAG: hypothetical protein EKK54_09950 [Neisseriaceae bacterium]
MRNSAYLSILLTAALGLTACNSGSNQSSNTPSNDSNPPTQQSTRQSFPSRTTTAATVTGLEPGNGIINYSVATDVYYGSQNQAPSLKIDMQNYPNAKLKYVFPAIGYITPDGKNSNIVNPLSNNTNNCNSPAGSVIDYMAQPQIKQSFFKDNGVTTPLGPCVNGSDATAYYKGLGLKVVPLFEYSDDLNSALTTNSTNTVMQIADNIASIINQDHNTIGVAIDNEKALSQVSSDVELAFFGELAKQLNAAGNHLFVFDAPTTVQTIYNQGVHINGSVNVSIPPQQNVVELDPLYDQESIPQGSYGPVGIDQYTTDTNKEVQNYFAIESRPPVMFVAPSSSTDTIWDSVQQYDLQSSKTTVNNPTTSTDIGNCSESPAINSGSVDNVALANFLCDNESCTATSTNKIITDFLAPKNCVAFKNTTSMQQFMTNALSAITKYTPANDPRYLGTTMYAWRIDAFNDIACAVHYYSQDFESDLYKQCNQTFPAKISDTAWSTFANWNPPQ